MNTTWPQLFNRFHVCIFFVWFSHKAIAGLQNNSNIAHEPYGPLKGITLKWKFAENVGYSPSGQRLVCFFIWTDLEKFSITLLAHQWILCSEWVPSQWESKQLIKTSHYWTSSPHDKHNLLGKTVLNKYIGGFWCERTTQDGLFQQKKGYYGERRHIRLFLLIHNNKEFN